LSSRQGELDRAFCLGAAQAVQPFVVGLAYADDATDLPQQDFGGSGTCIQVADRYFVLTAAHVVLKATSLDRILLLSTTRPKNTSPRIREALFSGGQRVGEAVDHCLLELHPKAAATLEREFVTLDGMTLCSPPVGSFGVIVGAPGELTSLHSRGVTATLAPWISHFVAPPPRAGPNSLCLEYPETHALPKPAGMSGAGLWAYPGLSDALIWVPTLRLCGVYVEHLGELQLLRALSIERAVRQIGERYPDCSDHVAAWLNQHCA